MASLPSRFTASEASNSELLLGAQEAFQNLLAFATCPRHGQKTYPENKHVKFLTDGSGTYTKALGLELDLSEKGLGTHSCRYALLVDDLKLKVANIESSGDFHMSNADNILKAL